MCYFKVDQFVDASSISIGKGFAGVMKGIILVDLELHMGCLFHIDPWINWSKPRSGRVFKGKKMAGRMGNKKVTKQNLRVIGVDSENNLLILKVQYQEKNSIIYLKDSVKKSS